MRKLASSSREIFKYHIIFSGAQVVPVFDSMAEEEIEETLRSINGMLIPGGAQVKLQIIKLKRVNSGF